MPSHSDVIEGLIVERDESRLAAYRILQRFAPRYEIDSWGKVYPWLHDIDEADAEQRASVARKAGRSPALRERLDGPRQDAAAAANAGDRTW